MAEVLSLAAFTDRPDGGNPAGVVLDASALSDAEMQAIAADVGYSETAFVVGAGPRVRYFSPLAEVPFCGHATIATAVALGDGTHPFATNAGEVVVEVAEGIATLTSVPLMSRRRLRSTTSSTPSASRPAISTGHSHRASGSQVRAT